MSNSLKETVRSRIDAQTKKEATAVLESIGLTPSDAIRMLMNRIATEHKMPFEVRQPNTVKQLKSGKNHV